MRTSVTISMFHIQKGLECNRKIYLYIMYYGYIWLDLVEKYILSALWSNISVRVFRKKLFQKVPKGRKISDLPRRDKTPYQAQALTGKPFVTVLPLFVSDHSGCLARHLWQTELFKKSLREKSDCFKQLNAFFFFFFSQASHAHMRGPLKGAAEEEMQVPVMVITEWTTCSHADTQTQPCAVALRAQLITTKFC